MKKGIFNVIIIVLLVTNLAFSAIMAFSVTGAMNDTSKLVSKVAQAIELQKQASEDSGEVSIDDLEAYVIDSYIKSNLKMGTDGRNHVVQVKVVFMLDKEDEGYSRYKSKIGTNEEHIKSMIVNKLSQYTNSNITTSTDEIKAEIRDELRAYFNNTKFINSVEFSEFIVS